MRPAPDEVSAIPESLRVVADATSRRASATLLAGALRRCEVRSSPLRAPDPAMSNRAVPPPSDADRELAARLAATTRFRRLVHVAECGSTQDLAADLPAGESAVVWAERQTRGRGRQGRSWHGEPGLDVEVSFRCAPIALAEPARLATAAPVAVLRALEPHAGRPLVAKWPNDVMCLGRKLCGVLIDATSGQRSTCAIGVGVNANRTAFPPELRESATSLALVSGHAVERHALIAEIAVSLDAALCQLEGSGDDRELAALFAARSGLLGRRVRIVVDGQELRDVLTSLDLLRAGLAGGRVIELARVSALSAV